ncbi:MAG: hypothetical protein WEB53_07225 [Akkermansiaceae bacterium]
MANVFGILTAIVLALAAFIATKNKAAYETKISETATQKDLLTRSQARLTAAQAVLAALPIERDGVDAEVAKLIENESAETKANEALKADSETKATKLAANKAKLDEIREKTSKTGDIKELASKMNATNQELERLTQSISSSEAKLANLTADNVQTESQIRVARDKFDKFSKGESLPSLSTRIRSIYPNWGFVTLAAGNLAGVVTNSTLNVVRNGEVIAQLLVTAVESNTASASIVPDSLPEDVTLTAGDMVVPGVNSAPKPGSSVTN